MKIIVRVLLSALLALSAFSFVACGKSSEQALRDSVEAEFNAYKNLEDAALDKIAKTAESEGLDDLGISGRDFASAVLNGFDFSIENIVVTGKEATVSIALASKSATDFEEKLSSSVQTFVDSKEAQDMSIEEKNAEIGKITMKAFEDTKIIDEKVDIKFMLENNTWTAVNASEQLANLESLVFAG